MATERIDAITMQLAAKLFNRIARSHMYWGRKPLVGLLQVFQDVREGIVLDPFCGAGTPAVAALLRGARVVATDLNPMAVFLTRVLIRPLSIPGLTAAFDQVVKEVQPSIQPLYRLTCHQCKEPVATDFILWQGPVKDGQPVRAKTECPKCGLVALRPLSPTEQRAQRRASQVTPRSWFPATLIHTSNRTPPVPSHRQLFTDRNLFALAEIYAAINRIESMPHREALQYVFTASLYSCSQMQMFSDKQPSSSRGWTALRYYVPPLRKETNVLHAFNRRFLTFLSCKQELNERLPKVRVTQDPQIFQEGAADLLVKEMPWIESLKNFGPMADRIFLDPPYHVDVDYFGFSEFWGSWLKMDFDFATEWHARMVRGGNTRDLLARVAAATPKGSNVDLALDPRDTRAWKTEDSIDASGYHIKDTGYFLYDNSYKRGADLLRRRDKYYVLERGSVAHTRSSGLPTTTEQASSNAEVYPYLRAMAFLLAPEKPSPETLRFHTKSTLLPLGLRDLCDQLAGWEIDQQALSLRDLCDKLKKLPIDQRPIHLRDLCDKYAALTIDQQTDRQQIDSTKNRNAYRSLCLVLVSTLLNREGWRLIWARTGEFEEGAFGLPKANAAMAPEGIAATAMFASQDRKRRFFVFFPDQDQSRLRESAQTISLNDAGQYRNLAVLILPTRAAMAEWRPASQANRWPRAFFAVLDEIRGRCRQTCPDEYARICCPIASPLLSNDRKATISQFTAQVIENVQVGGQDAPYYKLRFAAPGLTGIVPGQFIMMDTMHRSPTDGMHAVPWQVFKTSFPKAPQTYLKRPFGVHRAFYPKFDLDYLKRLRLPPSLATVMHTVLPDTFDLFYKVLPHGKGTSEMRDLRADMRVQMLGPLGNRFDIRKMINEGVKEVHVIGGGVGMAPLIFLVQALRFFGVSVKAFIGIESTSFLRYQASVTTQHVREDHLEEEFAAEVRDATIYYDDLIQAGVVPDSIFISYDKESDVAELGPPDNLMRGFVSDLYARHLGSHPSTNALVAFACGPTPMMKAVYDVAKARGVPLHVLMEKRMACGIGVCLSCVCKTKSSESGYSRVCKEGPVFDADEIIWK